MAIPAIIITPPSPAHHECIWDYFETFGDLRNLRRFCRDICPCDVMAVMGFRRPCSRWHCGKHHICRKWAPVLPSSCGGGVIHRDPEGYGLVIHIPRKSDRRFHNGCLMLVDFIKSLLRSRRSSSRQSIVAKLQYSTA
ncbi:unnamed protein product [Periconia digitata]|uniref:Uncharacterized protein n=1 Tax=Periconia digitata TaxID=1303443 RepID=A0A9W4U9N0_9PLEO|nr:unnamed protein product [Periconia digitata]